MKRKFEFHCEFAWLASSEINQLGFNWTFELEFKERSQSKADIISAEWKAWIYNINSSFISSVFSTCFPSKCLRICCIICDVHLPNVTQRRVCCWKSCTFVIHLLNLCPNDPICAAEPHERFVVIRAWRLITLFYQEGIIRLQCFLIFFLL